MSNLHFSPALKPAYHSPQHYNSTEFLILFATFRARFPSIDLFSPLFPSISTALKKKQVKPIPHRKNNIYIYEYCRILLFSLWFAFLLLTDNLQNQLDPLLSSYKIVHDRAVQNVLWNMWGYNPHQPLCLQVFSFIWLIKIKFLKLSGFPERGKDFSCLFPFIKCLQCHSAVCTETLNLIC